MTQTVPRPADAMADADPDADADPGANAAARRNAAPGPDAGGGMFRSLRVRNYRLYAGGQLVSLTGTWMQRVAQDWLVLQLTDSATALGVVTALQFAPSIGLGLWGGMMADRLDKRRLLFVTQTALALAALLLGLLDVLGVITLWQVMALALAVGIISAVDTPARQSFAIEMVGRADLANAVAINSTIFNVGRILGPAVAGVLITAVGTGWAFIVNSASSVAVLLGLALMRTAELSPSPRVARGPGQLREAVRYVGNRPDLKLAMALVFVVGTFGMNYQITTAVLAKQVFHRSAGGFGLLSSALAVGACAGAVLATRRRNRPTGLFLVVTAMAFGVIEIVAGSMPTFLATAVVLVPAGLGMLTFLTAANSSVQLGTDSAMRGRVMALYLMCFMGGTPFGAPLIGSVAEWFGPRWGMIGGGAISTLAALGIGLVMARRHGPARDRGRFTPVYGANCNTVQLSLHRCSLAACRVRGG